MSGLLMRFALACVRGWTWLYTWGMPPALRGTRRAEIDSDLWECQCETARDQRLGCALQIVVRLLLGIPDDLGWRVEQPAAAGIITQGSVALTGRVAGAALVLCALLVIDGDASRTRPAAAVAAAGPVLLDQEIEAMMTRTPGSAPPAGPKRFALLRAGIVATLGGVMLPHLAAQSPPVAGRGAAILVDDFESGTLANFLALPAVAQSQTFEAISIKPARSGDPANVRMRVLPNGDLNASAVPVLLLVSYAYDVPVNPSPRLAGLPGWRETYDIEAKAPANAVPAGLPETEKRRRMQGMIRALLADRFKLVMRVEQKPMPVYALTVASGGPNLRKSTIAESDCVIDTGNAEGCHNFIMGRGHPLRARAINMDDLVQYIENWTDLPVVNRTGISGLFAVETEGWNPMRLPPPPPGNPPAVRFDDLPTIFTVLRKLGLELKQQEATVPVYTVEHIERPAGE